MVKKTWSGISKPTPVCRCCSCYTLLTKPCQELDLNTSCFCPSSGEKPFECELCHKRFSRRDKLNMHSRSHTGEKPHKCKHCPYAAADSSSLKKHLRIHYDERPFKCQICPYASRNSSQLTVHLRSHTGRKSNVHILSICGMMVCYTANHFVFFFSFF